MKDIFPRGCLNHIDAPGLTGLTEIQFVTCYFGDSTSIDGESVSKVEKEIYNTNEPATVVATSYLPHTHHLPDLHRHSSMYSALISKAVKQAKLQRPRVACICTV